MTDKQKIDKQQIIADINKQLEILVCDYCGKPKPKGTEPCSCGKGDFWIIKE